MRESWQNKRNFCPHFYTTWKNDCLSFPTRRMVGGGWPLVPEILDQTDLVGAKTSIFNRYLLVSPQPRYYPVPVLGIYAGGYPPTSTSGSSLNPDIKMVYVWCMCTLICSATVSWLQTFVSCCKKTSDTCTTTSRRQYRNGQYRLFLVAATWWAVHRLARGKRSVRLLFSTEHLTCDF